ncbi:MAG: hypothetical protein H6739_29710 [Alphaproteobacteria bacterium]|nr:hypothetical protein [Alphaproteobacteria bacterium]
MRSTSEPSSVLSPLFAVRGQVTHSDGRPLSGLTIQARACTFDGEAPLGDAITDQRGAFEIQVQPANGRPNFYLRVVDDDLNPIAVTRVFYKGTPLRPVDLRLNRCA